MMSIASRFRDPTSGHDSTAFAAPHVSTTTDWR